jgi:hypothetical protein
MRIGFLGPCHRLWRLVLTGIGFCVLAACGAPEQDMVGRGSSSQPTSPAAQESDPPAQSIVDPTSPPPTPPVPPTATPFSPWHGTVAYVHEGNIGLLDLATGATTQLTDDGATSDPAWSPDAAWIAFAVQEGETSQIVRMRADGSDRTPLTSSRSLKLFPSYAPDSTLHFIRRTLGDTPQIEVVRLEADGGETVVHVEPGGLCGPTNLSVGQTNAIALSLDCGRGLYTFVITPVGDPIDVGAAIDGAMCAADGEWSRRSGQLLVKTAVECAFQQGSHLTSVDLSQNPIRTTDLYSGQRIGGFGWSPDDSALVFSTYAAGSGELDGLWIVDVAGGEPQQVLEVGSSPAWRP